MDFLLNFFNPAKILDDLIEKRVSIEAYCTEHPESEEMIRLAIEYGVLHAKTQMKLQGLNPPSSITVPPSLRPGYQPTGTPPPQNPPQSISGVFPFVDTASTSGEAIAEEDAH